MPIYPRLSIVNLSVAPDNNVEEAIWNLLLSLASTPITQGEPPLVMRLIAGLSVAFKAWIVRLLLGLAVPMPTLPFEETNNNDEVAVVILRAGVEVLWAAEAFIDRRA